MIQALAHLGQCRRRAGFVTLHEILALVGHAVLHRPWRPRLARPALSQVRCCYTCDAAQLADSLRRLRRDEELTQTEMAKRLGISQVTLARLEAADPNTTLKMLVRGRRAVPRTGRRR